MATMADRFFNGVDRMRQDLVAAMRERRERLVLNCATVDALCGLGPPGYPRSSDYERDPRLLTGIAFSLVALLLGLRADDVLRVDLSKAEDMEFVLQDMANSHAAAIGACGGDLSVVTLRDQAPVYVVLKAIEELDANIAVSA